MNIINRTTQILTTCLLSTFLMSCTEEVVTTEPVIRPVKTITISQGNAGHNRIFSGTSHFVQESNLSFKISGTVTNLPVKVGDELQAGDLIAEMSASSQSLEVQRSQASLLQMEANERNAKASYDRIKGLYANNNASKNDLDAARASAESAAAQTRSARKALELARLNLSYTRLTTPIDCRVSSVNIEVNENVNAGTPVVQTSCGQQMEVQLNIPESLIGQVQQNMTVTIQFSAIPGASYEGVVSEVAAAANSSTSTFPVVVNIQGTHEELRSGMGAEVTFTFTDAAGSSYVSVPLQAIVNDGEGRFVYVATPTETKDQAIISRKDVNVGELTSDGVEITSGLEMGDQVVVAGMSQIYVGQTVLVN